ncbi:PREDICTED: MAM and LDL-receptor class A domain-containing protein 1-like [Priapulus caudatus]|uniref:MAM and LDL-receptor class A domain-containing protein 1-like n=1 Tax=Priapulus caudatus TaxID=37621 RepID=A0ABM1FAN0_PRICU|nr:PREDICTED: MAM and LDL-receptor class A domain-containing protein 1-like [Priapulus caudatus]
MYIEGSSPRRENDTARLHSPVYSADKTPACFEFWYHMFGLTIGTLSVYVKPETQSLTDIESSFVRNGDQGNQWFLGQIAIPRLNDSFQIVIEGVRGTSYVTDAAIDDVSLNLGQCRTPPVLEPVDGHWSDWLRSSCTVTCGEGGMASIRYCNNPAPRNGGADCEGAIAGKQRVFTKCRVADCPPAKYAAFPETYA